MRTIAYLLEIEAALMALLFKEVAAASCFV